MTNAKCIEKAMRNLVNFSPKLILMRLLFFLLCLANLSLQAQEMYTMPTPNTQTRWSSFENLSAAKGAGGKENKGAKGHPAEFIQPLQSKVLLEVKGAGTIRRIWMTLMDRSPRMLRSLRLDMYWDGE